MSSTTDELRATRSVQPAARAFEDLAYRGMQGDVGAGVDGVRERRGQDHAGQRHDAAVRSAGKCGGLAAGERRVDRCRLPKIGHERIHPVLTTSMHARTSIRATRLDGWRR